MNRVTQVYVDIAELVNTIEKLCYMIDNNVPTDMSTKYYESLDMQYANKI